MPRDVPERPVIMELDYGASVLADNLRVGAGISVKIEKIAGEAREALAAGQCVVIGLQTTGESALEDHLARKRQSLAGAEQFDGFISVTKFIVSTISQVPRLVSL